MDYSKYGISKKKQNLRSTSKKAGKKFGFTVFRVFIICLILIGVVGVSAAVGGVKGIIDSAPEINISDIAPKGFKSYIYSKDGNLQHEIVGTGSNRIYASIDEIGKDVQNAFIALEDERFRTHNGVDPQGIVRAFFVGLKNGGFSEGASTITQQLLKLSVFSGGEEPSLLLKFQRKFQEQYLALELEKQLSKDEILEAYLNTINLGRGCYGIEAASNYYFNKSADELTVSEAASLASIAQSPTNNNPVDEPENNNIRRETTINYMYKQGLIDEETKTTALADTSLYTRVVANAENAQDKAADLYSYYEEAAIDQVIEDLQTKLGYTAKEAEEKVYSGALKIYLAQDQQIQDICDEIYADDSNFPMTEYLLGYELSVYVDPDDDATTNYNAYHVAALDGRISPLYSTEDEAQAAVDEFKASIGIVEGVTKYVETKNFSPQIQSSFVIMDQTTGYVSAVIAGRGEKAGNMVLNRATMSPRQPGSVFKIVSTYAPALDYVGDSLASSKLDKNVESYGGHTIKNVNKKESLTDVNFRDAIIQSKNTVAVRALQEDVGTALALKYLTENFHFTTMDMQKDAVDVLAIGGITNGVTNIELTAAFAAIANAGQYTKPAFYEKVLDANDNVLLDNTSPERTQAIKDTTAFLLTSAMEDVVTNAYGTAYGNVTLPGMNVAGKTGTTDDYKDTWFVGYTPYYTAGIWFGYDNNIAPDTRSGWRLYTHERLWSKIMNEITNVKGLENKDFVIPDGIVKQSVCKYTGLLPGSGCQTISEYLDGNNVPTERCTECRWASVCDVCGGLANENTASSHGVRYGKDGANVPTYGCTCEPPVVPETPDTEDPNGGGTGDNPSGGTDTPGENTGGATPPPNTPSEQ